jgi:hypothetical protein
MVIIIQKDNKKSRKRENMISILILIDKQIQTISV